MIEPERLTGLGPDTLAAWRFPAADPTAPGGCYDVALSRRFAWSCECRDWDFRGHVRPCKHVRAARRLWAREAARRPLEPPRAT